MTTTDAAGRRTGTLSLKTPPKTDAAVAAALDAERGFAYDFLVFVGRMRPFHKGHLHVVRSALAKARRVILLIGSARQARSPRNPFKWTEVEVQIRGALTAEENARVVVRPLLDTYNNTLWVAQVQGVVRSVSAEHPAPDGRKPVIGLIGHAKDHTSFYLKMFPLWGSEGVESFGNLSATPIRSSWYLDPVLWLERHADDLPDNVVAWMNRFAETPDYEWLAAEDEWYRVFRQDHAWPDLPPGEDGQPRKRPYEPVFVTPLAVVVQSGNVLLTERRSHPGKGLLALPGGYLGPYDTCRDWILNHLHGELRLKASRGALEGGMAAAAQEGLVAERRFDSPYRSERGRVVAETFVIKLRDDEGGLPAVRGDGFWKPLMEIDPESMFEDNAHIINTSLGMNPVLAYAA